MRTHLLLPAVACATAMTLAAPSAAAQQSGRAMTPAPRVVATYQFGARQHAVAFPTTVIVSDSAGTLVANARLAGEPQARPMLVTVIGSDLVLETQTKDGVLTLVLDEQAQGNAPKMVEGRWAIGASEGRLRGAR